MLEAHSLYDEFLLYLARRGHAIPQRHLQRDWRSRTCATRSWCRYSSASTTHRDYWVEYELCEKFIDVEESFQLWRFRHLKTVERIIGFKHGTGGSSGVNFLKKALELTFFPELLDVRTELGN